MRRQLTDDQVATARRLRAEGKSYDEIRATIGTDVSAVTIRTHCTDVPVEGKVVARRYVARTGRDGRMIRPFTAVEDDAIIAWKKRTLFERMHDAATGKTETMADLAKRLGRKRHSVAARITTLRRHGKLPAA